MMERILQRASARTIMAKVVIVSALPFLILELFHAQLYHVMDAASYLVFHNIAESFSVVVSLSIFGVGWYTYRQSRDRHTLFLSAAFLAIGLMDFMHTLSYADMPPFITPNSANKSTQFWIAVRLFSAATFLASAYVYPQSKSRWLSKPILMTAALAVAGGVFAGIILFPSYMPDTFVEGVGLTPFKKYSEYLIIGILFLAVVAYWKRMSRTGDQLLRFYLAAFVLCIFSELFFTVYKSVFDTYNVLGHVYKVAAFYLIYEGKFASSVKNPYEKLFAANENLRTEIGERKRAEEELQSHRDHLEELVRARTEELAHSEEKHRTLVENVPLVVYRMGPDGKILFVNHFVEEIFGFSPDDVYRAPELWCKTIHDEDRGRVVSLWEESFRKGGEFVTEYRIRHKNGRTLYVMDHAIPFKSADGLVSSVDGIIMDVTGRVKTQEKLIRAEGFKTISEVSARLAHEIRNPLVSAGGFARRLLVSMGQEDPNRGRVEIIVKEVGRLEAILRMILAYIQPIELERTMTDPNELVERALMAVAVEIKERNVRLDLALDRGLPNIPVDRPQMELAVETLVKKALNQMREGSTLSIATLKENNTFKLVMRYPVEHIARDDLRHFFYPFTSTRMPYDTVDLPMSKILVDKHGGEIDVRLEKPGEMFIHISLPLPNTIVVNTKS